jgi:hypothetical protein
MSAVEIMTTVNTFNASIYFDVQLYDGRVSLRKSRICNLEVAKKSQSYDHQQQVPATVFLPEVLVLCRRSRVVMSNDNQPPMEQLG